MYHSQEENQMKRARAGGYLEEYVEAQYSSSFNFKV
jgi:hypothetical protein